MGVELLPVKASNPDEIDGAFAAIVRQHADALFVPDDGVFLAAPGSIPELAVTRKLPAIYQSRRYVAAGGLISYGTEVNDLYRRGAAYVDKILKGEQSADIPVEQPTKSRRGSRKSARQAFGMPSASNRGSRPSC